MLWWVASTGFHIVLLGIGLASSAVLLDASQAFAERLPLTVLTAALAAFLFWTHRSNLQQFFAARQT